MIQLILILIRTIASELFLAKLR